MNYIKDLANTASYGFYSGKNDSSEKKRIKDRLVEVVQESKKVLCSAKTVFPLTLFTSEITVDRQNITITNRNFFKSGEIISIRIEDILNVSANVGVLFGTVKIHTRFFEASKPYEVTYLWRHEAIRLMHIIDGYIIALQKKVDCDLLNTKELESLLSNLGGGSIARI